MCVCVGGGLHNVYVCMCCSPGCAMTCCAVPCCTVPALQDVQFVCAMGPPGGGRTFVSNRYTRHFHTVGITESSPATLAAIFRTIQDWFLTTRAFPQVVQATRWGRAGPGIAYSLQCRATSGTPSWLALVVGNHTSQLQPQTPGSRREHPRPPSQPGTPIPKPYYPSTLLGVWGFVFPRVFSGGFRVLGLLLVFILVFIVLNVFGSQRKDLSRT